MATLKLVIRKKKVNKRGECLIFVAYGHDQKTTYFSTGEMVKPAYFVYNGKSNEFRIDSTVGVAKIKANEDLIKSLEKADQTRNSKIKTELSKINNLKLKFERDKGYSPSIKELREVVEPTGNAPLNTDSLILLYDDYIESAKSTKAPGTIKQQTTTLNNLKDFCEKTKFNLTLKSLDLNFYERFKVFLLEEKNLVNNSVGTQIKNIKAFLNNLKDRGYEISTDIKKFKVLKEKAVIIYHTEEELEKIKGTQIKDTADLKAEFQEHWKEKYNKPFPGKETLEKVKDLHLLACATGYRISDMKRLGEQHKGATIIKMNAHKTKKSTTVPLTPVSKAILEKYDYQLPVISDQKFNDYVKALCFLAGINNIVECPEYRGGKKDYIKYPKYELISSHVAVSTFITICGQKGISAKVVSEITGKTVKVILDHYYGTDESFIQSEMARAFGSTETVMKVS